ncbi:hypothetical protein TYRP_001360 [Tyrophagus putrescentiae]|nr:hypothetical protein TYRP_001360 [Tyrophagus putrescentiae]
MTTITSSHVAKRVRRREEEEENGGGKFWKRFYHLCQPKTRWTGLPVKGAANERLVVSENIGPRARNAAENH